MKSMFGDITVIEGLPDSTSLDRLIFMTKDEQGRPIFSDGKNAFRVLVRNMRFTNEGIEWAIAFEPVAHGGADAGSSPSTG